MKTRVETATGDYIVQNLDRGSVIANQVRIAGSSSARRRGLLGVEGLEKGSGIWIAPCEAIHTFGMKMPIDVVFLDREYRVNKLRPRLRPSRISVCLSACSVLELEAGAISRSTTRLGDRLAFEAAQRTGA
ncbi:MAG: DUF192 domain-containing protein [Bryobacteraceae bacterium]